MFRVILKTKNNESIIRANVVRYNVNAATIREYTTNTINMYGGHSYSHPITHYQLTIITDTGEALMFRIANINDVNEFVEKITMAEEEQITSERISMDDLYQYAAEKLLGGKHESIPGFKIPTVEFNGDVIDQNLSDHYSKQEYYGGSISTKRGF